MANQRVPDYDPGWPETCPRCRGVGKVLAKPPAVGAADCTLCRGQGRVAVSVAEAERRVRWTREVTMAMLGPRFTARKERVSDGW
jgi:hypothetical protein